MLSIPNRFIICSQYNHNLRLGLHLQKLPLHKPFRLSFIHCGLHQQMASAPAPAPAFEFLTKKTYTPPSWAAHLHPLPSHVFSLAHVCMKNHITSPNHIKPILIFFFHFLQINYFFFFLFFVISVPLQFTNGTFPICHQIQNCGSRLVKILLCSYS